MRLALSPGMQGLFARIPPPDRNRERQGVVVGAHLTRLALLAAAALLVMSGCGRRGAVIAHPGVDGRVNHNYVRLKDRTGSEQRRGLAKGALRNEASLQRFDSAAICFDVVLRSVERTEAKIRVRMRTDEQRIASQPVMLSQCTVESSCLAEDSYLSLQSTDTRGTVYARGGRVCFADHGLDLPDADRLVVGVTSLGNELIFRWYLDD